MTRIAPSRGEFAVPATPWVDLGMLPETAVQEPLPTPALPERVPIFGAPPKEGPRGGGCRKSFPSKSPAANAS